MNLRQPVEYPQLRDDALSGGQVFRQIECVLKKREGLLVCLAALSTSRFHAKYI